MDKYIKGKQDAYDGLIQEVYNCLENGHEYTQQEIIEFIKHIRDE